MPRQLTSVLQATHRPRHLEACQKIHPYNSPSMAEGHSDAAWSASTFTSTSTSRVSDRYEEYTLPRRSYFKESMAQFIVCSFSTVEYLFSHSNSWGVALVQW
ncbi:hypothetical protein AMECASPLE_018486 [Ameca splendens]|uniref:Uncharacterized protein n=1 Tax=Ameca splendens TaxID=208324 RepID=A0ABV0XFT8_9TELE